jgi:hypothetical protein
MAKLTLKESVQNLEWVATNIRELREIFTPHNTAPASVGDILVYSAALGALGIDPKEFGKIFLTFYGEVLQPLQAAGVCTIKEHGIGAIIVSRKAPDTFEIAAALQQTNAAIEAEPTQETRDLAEQFLSKLQAK